MRIRCPSCQATYDVADALLDPPRMVRCARCTHDWMPEPFIEVDGPARHVPAEDEYTLGDDPSADDGLSFDDPGDTPGPDEKPATGEHAAEHEPLTAIERLSGAQAEPRRRPRDKALTAAWGASIAALVLLAVAGYAKRDRLMQAWPASQRVYATFGLASAAPHAPAEAEKEGH